MANSHRLSNTPKLEFHGGAVGVRSQHYCHFVTWPERTLQPHVSHTSERARLPCLRLARTQSQREMRHARQNRRTVEMTVEATTRFGNFEEPGSRGRAGRRTHLKTSEWEESQRAGV